MKYYINKHYNTYTNNYNSMNTHEFQQNVHLYY